MKRNIEPYYVIAWDFNKDALEHYDVMPYLIEEYKELKKSRRKSVKKPETFDEFKEFILRKSQYQFWSRCQYEVIVTGWPQQKSNYKLDIYEQIEMNIDTLTKHFMSQL